MSNSAQNINPGAEASGGFYQVGVGGKLGAIPLLRQDIAILSEGNTDKQSEIAQNGGVLTPLSSKEVAEVAGYGSLSHLIAIMLFDNLPQNVKITYFFVPESGTGTITSINMAGTGTVVTKTGILTLDVMGKHVKVNLIKDDTLAEVLVKVKDAINANINLPCDVKTATPTVDLDFESKWKGQTSAELNVYEFSNTSEGLTFAFVNTPGIGEVLPDAQINKFVNDWYPHVLNCLTKGDANSILDKLEELNGSPEVGNKKYLPTNMTPYVAWTGTHESVIANLSAVTEPRKDFNTNIYLPVPNAKEFTCINVCEALAMFVKLSNPAPELDIVDEKMLYATSPDDLDVGTIIDYPVRDNLVKNGCSTVNFKDGAYHVGDLLTTYRPEGEIDPVFKFVRDNMLIFNLIDQIKKLNERNKNKTNAPNALPKASVMSTKLYKAKILNEIIRPFVDAGYLSDFDYAKDNLDVDVDPTNAGRYNVVTANLITSLIRIVAYDIQVNK
jgi:phage tail sheath gpL-like